MDDTELHEPTRPRRRRSHEKSVGDVLAEQGYEGGEGEEPESDEEASARYLRERYEELMPQRLASSGIPKRWREATFEELDRTENTVRSTAVEAVHGWAAGTAEDPGLLLAGPVGIGKSRMLATAAVARIRTSPVRWLSVAGLMMDLSMSWSAPEREKAIRALKPTVRGVALVFDDLLAIKPTEHAVQPLYVAINGWIEAELPLAATLNGDLDQLEADYGPRFGPPLASRLAEHCHVIELSGRDRRLEP